MDCQESLVLGYLKARPNRYMSPKEVGRDVADKQTYRDNPWWAKRALVSLAKRGFLQGNEMGHFRYVPRPGEEGYIAKKDDTGKKVAGVTR